MGLSAIERRPRQWLARDGRWPDLCDHRRRPLSSDPFPDRETALANADRRRHPRLAYQLRRERAAVCRLFNGRHSDELCFAGIRALVAIRKIRVVTRTRFFFIADRKGISVEPRYDHGNIVFTATPVGFINQFSARFGEAI